MKIDEILTIATQRNASDIHITTFLNPIFRINGELVRFEGCEQFDPDTVRSLLFEIIDDDKKKTFLKELELDFAYSIAGVGRFRVNYYMQRGSMVGAFRVIPATVKTVEDLRLPEAVKKFATYKKGLVLVTGPTGSGKSTTLASVIDIINTNRNENIITVEDPIEYLHRHKRSIINQREVGSDTKSFSNALKYVLREDPDVIMVGEMRDLETIASALTAAETGHLVFSTLHTQDAAQTIDRIIDVFPPYQQQQIRIQVAGTLNAVLVQQLLPTKDGNSRVVGVELMFVTNAIRNLIREGKTHQIPSSIQGGGKLGMVTMDACLCNIYRAGAISKEMAISRAHNKDDFLRMIGEQV